MVDEHSLVILEQDEVVDVDELVDRIADRNYSNILDQVLVQFLVERVHSIKKDI